MKLKTLTILSFGICILAGDFSSASREMKDRKEFRYLDDIGVPDRREALFDLGELKKHPYVEYDKSRGMAKGTDLDKIGEIVATMSEEEKKEKKFKIEIPEGQPIPDTFNQKFKLKGQAIEVPGDQMNASLIQIIKDKFPAGTSLKFKYSWAGVQSAFLRGKNFKINDFGHYILTGRYWFVTGRYHMAVLDGTTGKSIMEYNSGERHFRIMEHGLAKETLGAVAPNTPIRMELEAPFDSKIAQTYMNLGFVYREKDRKSFYAKDLKSGDALQLIEELKDLPFAVVIDDDDGVSAIAIETALGAGSGAFENGMKGDISLVSNK